MEGNAPLHGPVSGARLVGLRHLSQTERRVVLSAAARTSCTLCTVSTRAWSMDPPRLRLYLPYKSLVRRECYDNWWKVARFLGQVVAEHGDTMQAISNVWLGGMKHFESI